MLLWFGHSFSIFQCHLTLDVAHWLKRWALLTSICPVLSSSLSPTCCCPSYHSSLCSLKVRVEISSLPLPLSPMCTAPCPLCCIFLLSSLFIIQFLFIYFFCGTVESVCAGELCWFIPGVVVWIPCDTYLLPCWSAGCLPRQVWNHCLVAQEPSCFLSLMWHRETLHGLGVQGVIVLILLGAFFPAKCAPSSQQYIWFMELMLSASALQFVFKMRFPSHFTDSSWICSPTVFDSRVAVIKWITTTFHKKLSSVKKMCWIF
jgi:hypothetical protein